MANLVPGPVWNLIINSSATGIEKYNALDRYLYAVEVEIKKAEATLQYKREIERDSDGYKDRRHKSRRTSKRKTEETKTELKALRGELKAWREDIYEAKKKETWERFKYALTLDSQNKLEFLGTRASVLNDELELRISRRDEKDERRRKQEEWNWKQEQRRREQQGSSEVAAETPFSGGRLEILLTPLSASFNPPKRIVLPSWPAKFTIGRRRTEDRNTPLTSSDGLFDHTMVSRKHAEIWCGDRATVWVRDLGSSHGTFVTGIRLSLKGEESALPCELRVNDVIRFGDDLYDEATGETLEQPAVEARLEQIRLVSELSEDIAE